MFLYFYNSIVFFYVYYLSSYTYFALFIILLMIVLSFGFLSLSFKLTLYDPLLLLFIYASFKTEILIVEYAISFTDWRVAVAWIPLDVIGWFALVAFVITGRP